MDLSYGMLGSLFRSGRYKLAQISFVFLLSITCCSAFYNTLTTSIMVSVNKQSGVNIGLFIMCRSHLFPAVNVLIILATSVICRKQLRFF